jgi:hypothetical protein
MEGEEGAQHPLTREALEVAGAASGAAAGALAGYALGGPGGVVVGASAGEALQYLASRALGLRRRQAEEVLEIAARESARTVDDLLACLTANPSRLQLAAAAVVTAAAETALHAKVRALGRALATGALAADDAEVDEQRFLVDTLRDLEAPHVRVLDQISRRREGHGSEVTMPRWAQYKLEPRLPGIALVLQPVLNVLAGRALITQVERKWTITEFGKHCLTLLRESGREAEG